jgi:lysophospholipase L1-like esterase
MKIYSYLALGDSYTIGEQVRINESFPYQTVYNLRKSGLQIAAPEIMATSGFTTDELNAAIEKATLLNQYDFVSLLIGVNNQYRGSGVDKFSLEFEELLKKSIRFAGDKSGAVFVLSIPDWGVTPYAEGRDIKKISGEIDSYNNVCEFMAAKYNTHFLNVTSCQRQDGYKDDFLAADKLHPSGKEYSKWASLLSDKILSITE